ncbi:carbohydrate ABC transporter membrane protein 2, CUT1 family (TC 3.A.1.1.-) [Streptomyces sp. WMMB 714]|uniref:carbohydrate ABC transporter permease n=1 Tax=Streptomyces sp. WMMB 714 TaxID=1286822 RepID=UPI000823EE6A|nr:carbohydrate ABC transporter permease [Streptomyces sp. WMMB 714]SCK32373.1 carbohydrate ABC transporter membrane protein 2, CUT1 family (TC 3.A.1.1.-) [Streptomyces sp. WMMB 714]
MTQLTTPPAGPPAPEPTPARQPGGAPVRTKQLRHPREKAGPLGRALRIAALTATSVIFIYPFLWLVSASLKPSEDVFDNALIPKAVQWGNYADIWGEVPLLTWVWNSAVVTLAAAVAVTVSSAIVAFGFAYFRFPGRNALFALVISTMMLPAVVLMIPQYLVWNELHLASSQIPLWAPNLFGSAFYIFLLRQFFLGLPRELFEAARIDGASYWGMFWRIAVPLCRPALVVTFIFEVHASWTDLVRPLVYLRDPELYTVPRGLKAVLDQFGEGGEMRWEIVAAASVIVTVPMIIAFFLCQKHFVEGIATQGRKG